MANGNEFLPNYVEHLVPLQEKKMLRGKKIGIVLLGVFLLVLLIFATTVSFLQFLGQFIPFFLLGIAVLVWYLWRFVSVEFEYTISGGEITFDVVYGRRQRKPYYSAKISKMETIAPLVQKDLSAERISGATREVFCASSRQNPATWYAVVAEEGGGKTLLFFEMTAKAEKVLRFHNARAFFGA